jgi:aquaporin Z
MRRALHAHWPEYLIEAVGLGTFMVSASMFAALLYHPASPVAAALMGSLLQRALMGLAMGLTAVALVYSPWGRQSGAHFNPVVTLTFFRLGKVAGWDAAFYVLAQCAGGLAAMMLVATILGTVVAHPAVNYVVTVPGPAGPGVAFLAELSITFVLMTVVLTVSNTPRVARFTGLCAGGLVALYVMLEAPLSGMSMNPARTAASAFPAALWTGFWIYLTAPPLGMLLAAELHRRQRRPVLCAKLDHDTTRRCIFRCGYAASAPGPGGQ